jgi:hypothetical protein
MRRGRSLALLLFLSVPSAWAEITPDVLQKLRAGGYVLYLRHTSTDFSQNDARSKSYEDCENQRNLTDKGREEARALAAQLKRLRIPVGEVLASPFCRTMETGRLVFGSAQPMQEVRGGPVRTDDAARYDPLKKLMSTRPPAGRNTAISSHGNPFYAVFGPPYLAEGEMAVIDPSALAVVGRIRLEEWQALK